MKYALVDIGSNTIRLTIYDLNKDDEPVNIMNKKVVAGLASYMIHGEMTRKGIDKLVKTLNSFNRILKHFKADTVYVFATASLRNVSNRENILKEVKEKTNIEIDLISGEDEAYLGYLGAMDLFNLEKGVTIDIGGGSTEIAVYDGGKIKSEKSLDEGSLSLYSKFVKDILPKKTEAQLIKYHINKKLDKVEREKNCKNMVGVGGTIRACRNLISELYPETYIENVVSKKDLKKIKKKILEKNPEIIDLILKICPSGVHTLTPGLIALIEIMKKFKVNRIFVSDNGVREGYLKWKLKK